jgi:very-short-patch-repair endonuclease
VSLSGRWMAAVLACGPEARLSHRSAAALWGMHPSTPGPIELVVPAHASSRRPGIRVHRQANLEPGRRRIVDGIPVTDPVSTLVDLATCLPDDELSAAINEADHLGRVRRPALRRALDSLPPRPGVGRLRTLFARQELALPTTALESRFLRIVEAAGLPLPETQAWVNGHRVDFRWPRLGLVIETDSLRYHRTPERQSADMRRDHAHVSAGLTTLRFSHEQVRHEPEYVRQTLTANFKRLQAKA